MTPLCECLGVNSDLREKAAADVLKEVESCPAFSLSHLIRDPIEVETVLLHLDMFLYWKGFHASITVCLSVCVFTICFLKEKSVF